MRKRTYVLWWMVGVIMAILVILKLSIVLHTSYSHYRLITYRDQLELSGEMLDIDSHLPPESEVENNGATAALEAAEHIAKLAKDHPQNGFRYGNALPGRGAVLHERHAAVRRGEDLSWEEATAMLAPFRPHLKSLREATRQPVFGVNLDYEEGLGMDLSFASKLLKANQYLAMETLLLLREKDVAGAINNIQAGLRLAQAVQEQPNILCLLGSQAILTTAQVSTWEVIHSKAATKADLQRLQALWNEVTPNEYFAESLRMERAFILKQFAKPKSVYPLSKEKNKTIFLIKFGIWHTHFRDGDERQCLEDFQNILDAYEEEGEYPLWKDIRPYAIQSHERLQKAGLPLMLSKIFNSNLKGCVEKAALTEVITNMTATAIALRLYQLDHNGELPPNLDSLSKNYLEQVPLDPINGEALHYQNEGTDFLLYSVGLNDRDDGGSIAPATDKPARNFTDCMDIVWPRVAEPEEGTRQP